MALVIRKLEWEGTVDTVATPRALEEIQSCLAALWSAHSDIPDQTRQEVSLAVSEVGTNIIEYATKDGPILLHMELRLTSESIEIVFSDEGEPAAVDLEAVAMPSDLAIRGRGLAIAKEVLDELAYSRDGGRNQWTLIRRRFA